MVRSEVQIPGVNAWFFIPMSNAMLHLNNISITPKTSTSQILIYPLLTRRSSAYRTFKNNTKAAVACKREEAARYTRDRERHTLRTVCCVYVCARAHMFCMCVRACCVRARVHWPAINRFAREKILSPHYRVIQHQLSVAAAADRLINAE